MKNVIVGAFVIAALAGCASAPQPQAAAAPAPAKVECSPPPAELVVKDLQPGSGQAVRVRSAILVGYTGWLYDGCKQDLKGEMFDTSVGRPAPFGFVVGAGRVIKGWDEGLIGMREKGKRLLIIPARKAYGDRAAGGKIPPNSTLVFEVDLEKIVQQPPEG